MRKCTGFAMASLLVAACGGGSGDGNGGGVDGGTDARGSDARGSDARGTDAKRSDANGRDGSDASTSHAVKTVFLILMENHNWSDIKGSPSAPYINNTLLMQGSHAEQYFNPPGNHPSEPNYLWLEAGQNFGIKDDNPPSVNHQRSTAHLVNQLEAANVTWKAYEEDITGTVCPLTDVAEYAPKHCAFVFFDDVTNTNDPNATRCLKHVVPYTTLASDLSGGTTAAYNFITPNLCDDMHDSCAPTNDSIKQGDTWLSTEIPKIQASPAYKTGGVIIVTWDESELGDFPIGLIVLSSLSKPGKYSNSIAYSHSSTLRSLQEIFGVTPLLGDAAKATDLSDLFMTFP